MARTWKRGSGEIVASDGNWLEYGSFGQDTYGLHTVIDGRDAIIRMMSSTHTDAPTGYDVTAEADDLLDRIAGGWRAANWPAPDVISATEAADMLGVTRMRVNQLLNEGKLDGRKVGNAWQVYRYSVEDRMEQTRKPFEQYELDAYLGDFADDFDIDAIIDEATEVDYRTGNRYWRDGIDLAEICARHDVTNAK